ncbi:MAG: penicillin-binding protein 1C [Moorea sp. SIOASIH]|uniref:penicillin-binding protein 1C n=1 Tax=Moorena sp. SIOASIH TaxID=2607817 RepID=UPI0013B72A17|nr:transglycosylase domain-containing protein [Moorena sp. SIOASIH]NEO42483.1 penicillin-binding protein 1C [Moorena sp. SIOASIH]
MRNSINIIKQKIWLRLNPKHRRAVKLFLGLALLGITVRTLPYLAPIRAKDLVQDDLAVEFRDRNGLSLGTILSRDQDHTAVVPLDQISPHFIHAILAAEDGEFYHHGALEMRAIMRSLIQAIEAKRIVSGASTITMQLARMLEPNPRTLPAKFQEIWLSWRLAAGMSKDEILAAYINRLPMGGNIYGLEAAARIYFGMPASELNVAQASLLAGLPNNPNYLNPYYYWDAAKRRQIYVLNRMVEDGYITATQADQAYEEAISLLPRQQGIIAAPHFLFLVANQLPSEHPSQIRTTIDRPLQEFVEAQVQQVVRELAHKNVHHAAAIVIENQSGEVYAYVGSPDYFSEAELGRNDGVQALRQPGSTLKPFLYQLALEQRIIRPNTVLADIPTYYAIPGARLYSPTDYSETFLGPVRIRVALANSLNIPAVRVLEKVGVSNFLLHLHQLGFEHLTQSPEHYGLGLTLGSGEVSLWELARAYLTLARLGQPTSVVTTLSSPSPNRDDLSVYRRAGRARRQGRQERQASGGSKQLSDHRASKQSPLFKLPYSKAKGEQPNNLKHSNLELSTVSTWALITDILSDPQARAQGFGVDSVLNLPFPAAVKTGTSSNFRDTWTVGFTKNYTVATWVGNFNGEPMEQVSGVIGAAPLWHRIMLHLHQSQEPAPFQAPPGLVQRPVCALSGLRPTPACPTVVQEYFYPDDLQDYERQSDTFYQITSVGANQQSPQYIVNLPDEYNEWLARQPQGNLAPGKLKILSPREGDLYVLYPTESDLDSNSAVQRLEFKVAGLKSESVEWWLNGEKLTTNSSNSFFWPLGPGDWTLEVKSGDISDRVTFKVQLAENPPTRRGFSIAGP